VGPSGLGFFFFFFFQLHAFIDRVYHLDMAEVYAEKFNLFFINRKEAFALHK